MVLESVGGNADDAVNALLGASPDSGIARSETSIAATACSNERHLSLASFHLLGQQRSKRGGHSTENCGSHASATGNTSRPARQYRFKPAAGMHANARYSTFGAARTRPCHFPFDFGPSVAPLQPLSFLIPSVECSQRTFSCQRDMQCGRMRARRHMRLCRRAQSSPAQPDPSPTPPNPPPRSPFHPPSSTHPESTGRCRAVVRSTAAQHSDLRMGRSVALVPCAACALCCRRPMTLTLQ